MRTPYYTRPGRFFPLQPVRVSIIVLAIANSQEAPAPARAPLPLATPGDEDGLLASPPYRERSFNDRAAEN